MTDRRLLPARGDLAALHLQGRVDAARFVPGKKFSVSKGRAALRVAPSDDAAQDSELLFGESVTVYERKDGWAWGQAARDLYVGYLRDDALAAPAPADARVAVLMTPAFPAPDLKRPLRDLLPLGSVVTRGAVRGDYIEIAPDLFVYHRHLAPLTETADDFVAVAERFIGVPYVWGGKTAAGTDCSGLIQTALQACGKDCPRDSDMQQTALGASIEGALRRGDLVFWKGHVGVMRNETELLHANGFHMQVTHEPFAEAVARIEKYAGPVLSVKRL